MAHIQRRCARRSCRRVMPAGARACPSCGGREARWIARYRGPDRMERSRAFSRRGDAERFLYDRESAKARGEWIDPELAKTALHNWVDRWRGTMVHLKPKTRAGYESLLRTLILPELGRAPLGEIDPLWVREWVARLAGRGLSASRVRQAYCLLAAILRAAVESGYIVRTPCVGVRLPRLPQREMLFLSATQVRDLAEAAGGYGTLIYVLAYGGLRWGERRRSGGGGAICCGDALRWRSLWPKLGQSFISGRPRPTRRAPWRCRGSYAGCLPFI